MEKTFLILDLLQSAKRLVGLPPALLMGGSEWIVHQEMRNGTTLDRGAEKASRIIGSFLVGFLGTKKVEATDSLLVLVVGPDGKRMVLSLPTRGIEPGDWIESLLKKVFEKKGLADKPPDGWRITVYGPFNLSDSPGLILAGIRQLPRPYLVFELSRPDAFQVEPPLGAGLEEERLLDTGT